VFVCHEPIHVIQDRVGEPLLSEPLLTVLAREIVPSGEAVAPLLDAEWPA